MEVTGINAKLGSMTKRWWILGAVACGTFMATLDSSIVNIALPTLTKELVSDLTRVKWVVILYLLVITCLLLPFGRLSDQLGRKRVFQSGYLIFTIGSGLCSIAPTLWWLVAARVVQAIGASMLMANGPAIITAAFPGDGRGGALGTLSMVVSAGLISGPSLGGLLISGFGWRSIFLINIPVGLAGFALAQHFLDPDFKTEPKPQPRFSSFDWKGAILQSVILLSLIVLFDPPTFSFGGAASMHVSRLFLGIIVLGLILIFIAVESEAIAPLFDLSLMKIRTFWTSNLASLLTFVAFSAVTVLMPFFLEEAMHLPTHATGALMTAVPVTILIVAPISGRLSDKLGGRGLSVAGSLVGALALLAMAGGFGAGINEAMSTHMIAMSLAAIGLAIGLFQSPNNNAIMGAVPINKIGVASAFLATIRNLGLVIGTGLATGVFSWRMGVTHGDFVHSLHFTHLLAAFVALLATIASFGKKEA
jgi:EmrB/QacA subfamily drug resistance transporter